MNKKEMQTAKYKILESLLYKHAYNCIDNEMLQVYFFANNLDNLKALKNIVQGDFKHSQLICEYVEMFIFEKSCIEIKFSNKSNLVIQIGNENQRGYRYNFAVIDTNIPIEIHDCCILPRLNRYKKYEESDFTKNNYCIEYADFNC